MKLQELLAQGKTHFEWSEAALVLVCTIGGIVARLNASDDATARQDALPYRSEVRDRWVLMRIT